MVRQAVAEAPCEWAPANRITLISNKTWESNGMKIMNSGMCKMRDFSTTINTVNVDAELSAHRRALAWLKDKLASLQGQLKLGV